jgi:hypothetical protein
MNSEALHELTEYAETLAYQAILHSGLYRELTGEQWNALTKQYAAKLVEQVQGLVDAELTRREAENQELDAWLTQG